ncbi:hypothetical protein H0H87_012255 [Tephrocybe sp. NHM501043]|nr:hypothetical protein H0H87_012255 [Tephrocybe sp. NHM501043]
MGSIPWPNMNDDDVRQHVIGLSIDAPSTDEEGRPPYPENLVHALRLEYILHAAWHQSPGERPSFKKLASAFKDLRAEIGLDIVPPSPRIVISEPKSMQGFDETSPRPEISSPGMLMT